MDRMDLLNEAFGLDAGSLGVVQVALRTVVVYAVALAFVRIGDKRFLGKNTAFDVVVGIMFGSVMSRAITDTSMFVSIMVSGGVMLAIHWLVAWVTFHSDKVGDLVKGRERRLVADGEIKWDQMQAAHITERDLMGGLRSAGNLDDLGPIGKAVLERSGEISVVKRSADPRVVSVNVADGVHTVRIEIQ